MYIISSYAFVHLEKKKDKWLTRLNTVSTISLLDTSPTSTNPVRTANFILIPRIGMPGFKDCFSAKLPSFPCPVPLSPPPLSSPVDGEEDLCLSSLAIVSSLPEIQNTLSSLDFQVQFLKHPEGSTATWVRDSSFSSLSVRAWAMVCLKRDIPERQELSTDTCSKISASLPST